MNQTQYSSSTFKVIKSVSNKNFEISLVQLDSGGYCIQWEKNEKMNFSETMFDFAMACFFFDIKLIEIEGH